MRPNQPPTIIVKQERPPSLTDWCCAIGCGIPVVLFILGAIVSAIQNGLGL